MTSAYGSTPNEAFLDFIGPLRGTVVDVGPGRGAWAPLLRRAGAETLIAVEPDPAAYADLAANYDHTFQESLSRELISKLPQADHIFAADVLEHLMDPWAALTALREVSAASTQLHVSVPNLRFIGLSLPLLLRGEFTYTDAPGLRDRGHIRWFTTATLSKSLQQSGWRVVRHGGAQHPRFVRWDRLSGGVFRDLLRHQIHVTAIAAT